VGRPLWLTKLLIRTGFARFLPIARRLTDGGVSYLRYYSDDVLASPVVEFFDPVYFPGPVGPDVIDLDLPAPRRESGVSLGGLAGDRKGNPPAWGMDELREAVAGLYARRDGRAVDPERDVLVTHGATAAYAAALDAFVNPGDRVVLFDPCSPLFALGARSRRAVVHWMPTWNEDGRLRFPQKLFERTVRSAKLLVLSDPGNPNGACLTAEDLEYVAWISAGYDLLVYLDESFTRFRYNGTGPSLAAMPGAQNRVLTAGSVSQEYGLGSLRVGWLAGQHHLVKACAMTASLSAPYVPVVCQQAATRAIAEPDGDVGSMLDQFRNRRQYVSDRLRALDLEPDWPGGGYFAWVSVAGLGMTGRQFAERLLREHKVLVRPGCVFGPSGEGHIRISFAADDGRLREGLTRLAAFVTVVRGNPSAAPTAVAEESPQEPRPADHGDEQKPVFSRA
jgi:aspartate/methionine/tyrosine aminotransferase